MTADSYLILLTSEEIKRFEKILGRRIIVQTDRDKVHKSGGNVMLSKYDNILLVC